MLLLSGFALGVMSILALVVYRDYGHTAIAKTFVAILFAGGCLLIEPHLSVFWQNLAADIYTTVPALFWILCQLAFSNKPKILSPVGIMALYTFLPPFVARHLIEAQDSWLHFILWQAPTYFEYIVICLGLWTVIENWSDDLVESRRQLRGAVLIGVGVSVLLVVIPLNTQFVGKWLPYLSISVITLICGYFLLYSHHGGLFGDERALPDTPLPDIDVLPGLSIETQQLNQLMEQGFYRKEHLTLKQLAEALEMPEYKTRSLINQTLGYRNFNDYINQLRIREAASRLIAEPDTPVLNISLDVGYRTLSSFNRAFKDIMEMSPTEFRQS